jgi:hypothetical protein
MAMLEGLLLRRGFVAVFIFISITQGVFATMSEKGAEDESGAITHGCPH